MIPEYNTNTFCDVFPDVETFLNSYKTNGIPVTIDDEHATTLYYLLTARYKNDPIANRDQSQFVMRVFSIIYQYGPTWQKRLYIQKRLRDLSEEELVAGATNIYNTANNPADEPTDTTKEELDYINQQNVNKYRKGKPDAYATLWELLKVDVTENILREFKKLFKKVVIPENPLLYCEEE